MISIERDRKTHKWLVIPSAHLIKTSSTILTNIRLRLPIDTSQHHVLAAFQLDNFTLATKHRYEAELDNSIGETIAYLTSTGIRPNRAEGGLFPEEWHQPEHRIPFLKAFYKETTSCRKHPNYLNWKAETVHKRKMVLSPVREGERQLNTAAGRRQTRSQSQSGGRFKTTVQETEGQDPPDEEGIPTTATQSTEIPLPKSLNRDNTQAGPSSRATGKQPEQLPLDQMDGNPSEAIQSNYTKNAYNRDALGVLMIYKQYQRGDEEFQGLEFLEEISSEDLAAARSLYRLLFDNKKQSVAKEAEGLITSKTNVLQGRPIFMQWLTRFRNGPVSSSYDSDLLKATSIPTKPNQGFKGFGNELDDFQPTRQNYRTGYRLPIENKPSKERPAPATNQLDEIDRLRKRIEELQRQQDVNNHEFHQPFHQPARAQNPRYEEEIPFEMRAARRAHANTMNRRNGERNPHQTHQGFEPHPYYWGEPNYRLEAGDPRPVTRDDPLYAHEEDFDWAPRANRRLETLSNRQRSLPAMSRHRGMDRNFNNFSRDNRDPDHPEERPRSLRPSDIMIFDPVKHTVAFFIRRFSHIADIEGERAVLRVLPMCLAEGQAMEWHNSLSDTVRREMNQSLAVWEDELLREFRPNRFESMKKAEKIVFRFDDHSLSLSQYLSRKTNLLHDAGLDDEDLMVRYLWEGLEARLALATPLRETGDTLESFGRRVRNNEAAARRVHDLERRQSKSYQPKFTPSTERINRLLNNIGDKGVTTPAMVPAKRPLVTTTGNRVFKSRNKPPRPCRHCGNAEH